MDDLRLGVCDSQHAAQWAERRHRLHSRRAKIAECGLIQQVHSARSKSGIHGDCAQLSWIDRLWQGI